MSIISETRATPFISESPPLERPARPSRVAVEVADGATLRSFGITAKLAVFGSDLEGQEGTWVEPGDFEANAPRPQEEREAGLRATGHPNET